MVGSHVRVHKENKWKNLTHTHTQKKNHRKSMVIVHDTGSQVEDLDQGLCDTEQESCVLITTTNTLFKKKNSSKCRTHWSQIVQNSA